MSYKYIVLPSGDVKYNPQFTIDDVYYINYITYKDTDIKHLDSAKLFLQNILTKYYTESEPGYEDNLLEFFYEERDDKITKGSIIGENCHGVYQYNIYYADSETTLEQSLVEAHHDDVRFNKNNRKQVDITTWEYKPFNVNDEYVTDESDKIYKSATVDIKDLDVCFISNM